MESKNIKVIDEHSIDRNANVICAIDVDGSDYVVYWIERDAENDNVFVSKLLKNIDGTSSMINIEDSMEKSKMDDIVKELIKHSIDNEATTMEGKNITLKSGKVVGISSILVNKEQYINVQKTYITTVKKSVIKVSEDYYNVKGNISSVDSAPVVSTPDVFQPIVEPVVTDPAPSIVEPVVQAVNVTIPNVVANDIAVSPTPIVNESVVVEPVIPVVSETVVSNPVETVVSTPVTPVVNPVQSEVVQPVVTPVVTEVNTIVKPEVESVVVQPEVVLPVSEPVVTPVVELEQPSQLIFDASKESNLNVALGEVSSESKIVSQDISPIREFGEELPKVDPVVSQQPVVEETKPLVKTKSLGFANNKFFMFIAIAFFVASCVFLGYEVFNYFQLVK